MSDVSNAKEIERTPAQLLGKAIAERRESRGVSQRQMAKALQVQQATLSKIELGLRAPTREQARAMAKFFDYELTELHLTMPDLYPAPPLEAEARKVA